MNLSKDLAILISMIFFLGIVESFLFNVLSIFPEFSFSENHIVGIVSLVFFIFIIRIFYNYLKGEVFDEKMRIG